MSPIRLAEEMAADLASDLSEAEADGVSAEELLGSSVFDPRSFAASWAAERGIIPVPPSRRNARRRPLVLVAFTALAAITLIVAALLLLTGQPTVVTRRFQNGATSASLATSELRRTIRSRPASGRRKRIRPGRVDPAASSRSSRSASLPGCGRTGAARGHPPPPPSSVFRHLDENLARMEAGGPGASGNGARSLLGGRPREEAPWRR